MGINTKYLPLFEQIVKNNPNFKLRYVIDKGHLAHNTLIIADENNNLYGLIMIVMGNENADVETIA